MNLCCAAAGMNKAELRREKIAARNELSDEERRMRSIAICRHILDTPEFMRARIVMIYKAAGGEAALDCLEAENAKRPSPCLLAYPVCHGEGLMSAVVPGADSSGNFKWKKGAYGIMEPDPEYGCVTDPGDIDLVICPCTAYDGRGNRLGMGGGYYDRFLPRCERAAVIAAAYEVQRAASVPAEPWDRRMDMVVTEAGCFFAAI